MKIDPDPDADPDPLVRGMDPRIRNTGREHCIFFQILEQRQQNEQV